MRVPFALALLAASAAGAAQYPPEIDALVQRARSAPAEFAADVLIRLAASTRVTDKAARRELLEEAYTRAQGAQQRWKRVAALAPPRGTPADLLSRAYAQDVDGGSLSCRVVRAMLDLDPARARRLFEDLPRPAAPSG